MTAIYEVSVESSYVGPAPDNHILIRVAASSPMAACEHAERIAATKYAGANWAAIVYRFFAFRVRELTAAETFPELTPRSA